MHACLSLVGNNGVFIIRFCIGCSCSIKVPGWLRFLFVRLGWGYGETGLRLLSQYEGLGCWSFVLRVTYLR